MGLPYALALLPSTAYLQTRVAGRPDQQIDPVDLMTILLPTAKRKIADIKTRKLQRFMLLQLTGLNLAKF